jgi:hypothetical protein
LGEWAKLAPLGTAGIATVAALIAIISILVQRSIAKRRAAIDFFLKTDLDEKMIDAHTKYRDAVSALKTSTDLGAFAESNHGRAMRTYLNIHELMAVGVHRKVFHNGVCYAYWVAELKRACEDCNRYLLYLKNDPNEKGTFSELVKLNSSWQRGY